MEGAGRDRSGARGRAADAPAAPNDAEAVLRAARAGDADALDALLRRYQPQVLRFGMRMCRNPDDAREVLQETLIAAARTLRGFRGASSLSTWLFTIARSFCIKRRRRGAFAPPLVSLEAESRAAGEVPDRGRDPERSLADREIAQALEAAIRALDPGYREVLLLRDVEGLSAAEVAEVTGLGVPAVKSRLHRARAAVRAALAPLLLPEGERAPSRSCPAVADLLSRHLEGEIDRDQCAAMERHVAACTACAQACASLRETLSLCAATPAATVPDDLQQEVRAALRSALAARPS